MTERLRRWAPPVLAVQFLTRLPVPDTGGLSSTDVQRGLVRAVGWFPLVGALIGLVTAAVAVGGAVLAPTVVAVLVASVVEARLTGCFHEDAVADFCDAFGGGQNAEQVHRIMKDSRIGSYGTVGLVLALGLRVALTVTVVDMLSAPTAVAVIVAASTFGRLVVVVAMAVVRPAERGVGLAKDIGSGVGPSTVVRGLLAASPGLVPMLLLMPLRVLVAALLATAFLLWFRRLLLRRLGGSTGDCLGLAAYAGQLLLLLAAAAG